MSGKTIRRIQATGNSLAVTIPSEYVESKGLRQGDYVEIVYDDMVHIKPVQAKKLEAQLEEAKRVLSES